MVHFPHTPTKMCAMDLMDSNVFSHFCHNVSLESITETIGERLYRTRQTIAVKNSEPTSEYLVNI